MKSKILKLAACALCVATLAGSPVVTYAAPIAGACATTSGLDTQTAAVTDTATQNTDTTTKAEKNVFTTQSQSGVVAGITSTISNIQTTGASDVIETQGVVADAQNNTDTAMRAAVADVVNNNTSVVTAEFNDIAIANIENYVNVRSAPSEDSEVVGKLYKDCAATVHGREGDWYQITSGSCNGYIKAEYLIVGDANAAKKAGRRVALVNTQTLHVRTAPSTDAGILGSVPQGEDLTVTDESITGWVKVSIEEGEGYVSTDYVDLSTEYKYGESAEEERERLEAEEQERKAAAEAAKAAEEKREKDSDKKNKNDKDSDKKSKNSSKASGSGGSAVASYACQFVGNPYVYGGSSLTNGTDCSGFVMSVYGAYGISLPHSSSALRGVGYGVSTSDMQPGDIVCYSGHVGIYIGNGSIVHASTPQSGIKISTAYYRDILAVRRIF